MGDFVRQTFNKKQKIIFEEISSNKEFTASGFVEYIFRKYGFSKHSVWYNIQKMKSLNIIKFGDSESKGSPIEFTDFGEFISKCCGQDREAKCDGGTFLDDITPKIKVGIIGGMPIDTAFGVEVFRKYGFDAIGKPASETSQELTRLAIMEPERLTKIVSKVALHLKSAGAKSIVLYCNTMAGAIDVEEVIKAVKIPVVAPQDVYKEIAKTRNKIGLLAASPTSASKTERAIVEANPKAIVIGYGNLEITHDVERGVSPQKIIEKHGIFRFSESLRKNGVDTMILGCTHFPYFYDAIKQKAKIKIVEPSEEMKKMILDQMAPARAG